MAFGIQAFCFLLLGKTGTGIAASAGRDGWVVPSFRGWDEREMLIGRLRGREARITAHGENSTGKGGGAKCLRNCVVIPRVSEL